ncbi:MAG TPA: TetR/AcrR family transcriptional regulator [Caulobacteraceae bacterium]|nr:TetR/AcrR family transcriptional regulator [Caulobacteraceae bacterium]
MTFVSTRPITPSNERLLTGRALAKQRTREKILEAGRNLFNERGYEGATVRDIARAAGKSTGAVFASFADKAELFDEIVAGDYRALEAEMADALREAATVEDALLGLFGAAYRSHAHQLPMVCAAMSAGWSREPSAIPRSREALKPVLRLVGESIQRGVDRGELAAATDVRLLRGIVWELYLSGYRSAIYEGLGAEDMSARLGDQLRLVLAGVRA